MIQPLVLRTNTWPVVRTLYRIPYRFASSLLGRAASQTPGVLALYARGSFATGQWIPGRSDIDLTAVLTPGLSPPEELAAARQFHARAIALRRRFPMIGEVEFLAQDCLSAYAAHAFTGFQTAQWLPLTPGAAPPTDYRYSASRLHRDRLAHALRTYRQDVPPAVQSRFHRTLTRLTGKIFRTLGQLTPDGLDAMPLALLAPLAFDALAAACQGPQLPLPAGVPSAIAPNATYRITAARPKPADFGASAAPIIPMTPGMFTQYLALADPAEQFLLTARGLLPEQMAIPDPVLAESVRRYAVDIYTFPFREHALTLPPQSFQGILNGWFLWTLRYLETGSRAFGDAALSIQFQQQYPQLDLTPATPLSRFIVLRQIARLIAQRCNASTVTD
jgi:hypothetical protein